jgi:hypothetical protein
MSITIFSTGSIDSIDYIPALIADIKEIADEHQWNHHIIDDDFDGERDATVTRPEPGAPGVIIRGSLGLKGIIVTIAGAEPFSILFDRSGVLTDIFQQLIWIESKERGGRFTSCKTQFADIESHIRIIEVLDFLKQKYIPDLEVNDEGAYWEKRDRRILAEKRIYLGHCLRHVEKVIAKIDFSEEDRNDAETISSKIEEALIRDDGSKL